MNRARWRYHCQLRRAELGIIGDVLAEPALIESDIEALRGVAARGRRDLHEPYRIGAGDHARIESAFLTDDRVDDAAFDLGSDLLVFRHPEIGKRVTIERQTAAERRLADQKRCPGVVVARSDAGESGQRAGIAGILAEISRRGRN